MRLEIACADLDGDDLDLRAEGAGRLQLTDRLHDLQRALGRLADGLPAAGPGAARRDQADMADHRNGFVGHALDRGVAGAAIDRVGAGLVHLEGPADEIVARADLEEVLARHGKQAGRGVAVARVEQQLRRDRHDVDAGPLGGLGFLQRHHAQHGQLALALHGAKVVRRSVSIWLMDGSRPQAASSAFSFVSAAASLSAAGLRGVRSASRRAGCRARRRCPDRCRSPRPADRRRPGGRG